MKIDIKSILILVLIGGSVFFGYKWYYSDTNNRSEYKDELKKLKSENERLYNERDSNRLIINNLKIQYDSIKSNEYELIDKISDMTGDIIESKNNSNKSKKELDRLKKDLDESRRKIYEMTKNPPIKEDDELLNSLKNNL